MAQLKMNLHPPFEIFSISINSKNQLHRLLNVKATTLIKTTEYPLYQKKMT